FTIIGALSSHGFESDLYFNIHDFTKKIALIPVSAKTKEGIQELLLMLCGLSQKYLHDRLLLGKEAKGVILEIKKDRTINYLESILYDGELNVNDEIAIASFDDIIVTKIRSLQEILPLSSNFKSVDFVKAASGLRMQIVSKSEVLPGMPFMVLKGNIEQIKKEFKKEVSENIKTDKYGIVAKADSLGSLEALLILLRQENFNIVKAGIGNINKSDVITAKANLEINELDSLVVGFNISVDDDAKELAKEIKIITGEVVYKIIEDVKAFRLEKAKEIEKERLIQLSPICKLKILHSYIFRNSNPAVFGVEVLAGKLK
ncbi:MAG: translation initiation factor IF-2, partial [Nanoarchaeota archaeon]